MNRCTNCNIIIYDERETCPLCHKIVDDIDEKELEILPFKRSMTGYPDVRTRNKRIGFILRIILFAIIVAEIIAIVINCFTTPELYWSALCGASAAYIYLILVYWIKRDMGFSMKIALQFFMTMLFLFAIDYYTGMKGWALTWAIPGLILLGDVSVFFFMMMYIRNWFSYIPLVIFFAVCSVIILILYFVGYVHMVVMPVICTLVSGLYLLSVILFGNREFSAEMQRRFHV